MGAKNISKNKAINIVLSVISGVLLLVTLFFIAISLIFSNEKSAPNVFGTNIYLVRTSAFDLIEDSSAVFVQSVPFEEITPGNIIIYSDSNYNAQIAEVRETNYGEGVFTYKIRLEDDSQTYIGQSVIIGKAMSYSTFLGGLISFVTSPFGLLIIVFIPGAIVIALEIIKTLRGKKEPITQKSSPKKAEKDDTDYIPIREPRVNFRQKPAEEKPEAQRPITAERPVTDERPIVTERQAINAYTQNISPLFTPPVQKASKPTPKHEEAPSSMRLESAIAQAKAERELTLKKLTEHKKLDDIEKTSKNIKLQHTLSIKSELTNDSEKVKPSVQAHTAAIPTTRPQPRRQLVPDDESVREEKPTPKAPPEQNVKEFVPHSAPQTKERRSSASLDRLLSDDKKPEKKYNIDDILKSLERK